MVAVSNYMCLSSTVLYTHLLRSLHFGGKLYLSYKFVMWGKDRAAARCSESGPACISLSLPAARPAAPRGAVSISSASR